MKFFIKLLFIIILIISSISTINIIPIINSYQILYLSSNNNNTNQLYLIDYYNKTKRKFTRSYELL